MFRCVEVYIVKCWDTYDVIQLFYINRLIRCWISLLSALSSCFIWSQAHGCLLLICGRHELLTLNVFLRNEKWENEPKTEKCVYIDDLFMWCIQHDKWHCVVFVCSGTCVSCCSAASVCVRSVEFQPCRSQSIFSDRLHPSFLSSFFPLTSSFNESSLTAAAVTGLRLNTRAESMFLFLVNPKKIYIFYICTYLSLDGDVETFLINILFLNHLDGQHSVHLFCVWCSWELNVLYFQVKLTIMIVLLVNDSI